MKKLLLLILLLSVKGWSQSTTATGQILDPTGKRYCNASITFNLINPTGKPIYWNNSPLTGNPTYSGTADSNANFSMSLPDLNFLGPGVGYYYQISIASTVPGPGLPGEIGQPTPPAFSVPSVTNITGATVSLTAQIQAVSLPSVPGMCDSPSGGGGGTAGIPFKFVPNCSASGTVANETVQESNQLVNGALTTCATVGQPSSTSIVGICSANCGTGGTAQIAISNTAQCPFDNSPTQNDYVVPSTSVVGWCSDAGPVKPSSSTTEVLGTVYQANAGGPGTASTVQVAALSLLLPGATGGSGTVTTCSSGAGANAYYPGIGTVVACDPLVVDINGGMGMNFLQLRDSGHAGFYYQTQGPQPPAPPVNSIEEYPPASVPTPYSEVRPGGSGAVGQTRVVTSTTTDSNGNPILVEGWGASGGGGVQAQTNGVNNANCSGSNCPLINATSSNSITVTNPSGGNWQWQLAGHTQVATPNAPTLTVNGTTGSTQYCYAVVAVEDRTWVTTPAFHTPLSGITCTSSGNATLSSSNSITLSAYGDTLYGANGFIVCRTTGGSTQGIVTGLLTAGKKFTDTGLTADGSSCSTNFTINTTDLIPNSAALPGCNILNDFVDGPDAPPCNPTAFDDEMRQTFGAPADVNDPFWAWFHQNSATGVWSNGAIVITSDTATDIAEGLTTALPGSTPFTFVAYVDQLSINSPGVCAISFLESSTSKTAGIGFLQDQTFNSTAANQGGSVLTVLQGTFTSGSFAGTSTEAVYYYPAASGYLKIQDDGTNIKYSWSNSGDGIAFKQFFSQTISGAFTTAPNELMIWSGSSANGASVCMVDYVRRTQ